MRDYRTGPDREPSFAPAPAHPGEAHDVAPTPARTQEADLCGKLTLAAEALIAGVAVGVTKLRAAQSTAADHRAPAARRGAHDEVRAAIERQFAHADEARSFAVKQAGRHHVDATVMLATFDAKVLTARRALGTIPDAPARYASFPQEPEIEAVLATPPGPERNATLLFLCTQLAPASKLTLERRLQRADSEDRLAQAFHDRTVVDRLVRGDVIGILQGTKRLRLDPRLVRSPSKISEASAAPGGAASRPPHDAGQPHDQAPPTSELGPDEAGTDTAPPGSPATSAATDDAPQRLPAAIRGQLESAVGASLGHVSLHAGARGNAIAQAHGARAVAIGSDIHLARGQLDAERPEGRELLAHEVAHTRQAEVHGGASQDAAKRDGAATDAAENEAEDFAAQFRDRGGAAHWRPTIAIGRAAMRAPAPSTTAKPTAPRPVTAAVYFADHQARFFEAIRTRLAGRALPPPHERLVWVGDGAARGAAFERALTGAFGADMDLATQLPALLYPADPFQVIDLHRDLSSGRPGERSDGQPAMGPATWNPVVGQALALEIEVCLRRSLPRMGLRYVAQADDYHGTIAADQLVTSQPFDRVVARLLCDPAVARFVPSHSRAAKHTDTAAPAAFKDGLRQVMFEWQGARDPKLWNWVRVTAPLDARPEEVASWVFERGDGQHHTEYAYALTAAPPYYRIPAPWARKLPGAAEHAPAMETDEDAQTQSALDLADSPLGDDAARAQAGKPGKKLDLVALQHTLDRSEAQLQLAGDRLADWQLGYLVGPALRWLRRHKDVVRAAPDETLQTWAAIAANQSTILLAAVGELVEVADLARSARVVPGNPEARPFRDVLEAFGIAMGESHLAQAATAQLASARQRKAMLPLTLLDRTLRDSHDAAQELAATEQVPASAVDHVDRRAMATATNRTLAAGTLALREKALASGSIDAAELEALTVAASEETLRTRILTLYGKLSQLLDVSDDATDGFFGHVGNVGNPDIWDLRTELVTLRGQSWDVLQTMQREAVPSQPIPKDPAVARATFAHARKQAVANAQASFARLTEDQQLHTLFQRALDTLSDAQKRTAYFKLAVEVAALVGVSVVGSVAGAAVGGLMRGAVLADAAVDTAAFARTATAARWAGGAANLGTDVLVQAGVQTSVFGDNTKLTFVESVMTNLMTLGALRPFHGITGAIGKLDRDAVGLWKVASGGKVVLVEASKLTVETLVAAGAAYVAARLLKGKPPPSEGVAVAWAMQGAAMAVGKFVHGKLQGLTARLAKLGEQHVQLRKRARAQATFAKLVEQDGSTESALLLLEQHARLLQDEHAVLRDPAAIARLSLDATQLGVLRAGNHQALTEAHSQSFDVMKLRFRGLEPIAGNGLVWSGTRAQIEAALGESGSAARNAQGTPDGRWTAEIGGRRITFVEVQPALPAHGTGAAPGHVDGSPPTVHDGSPTLSPTEEHDLVAKGASPYAMGVLARVLAIDPPTTRRLIRVYGEELLERLATQPFTDHTELEAALVKQHAQVKDRVQGLYESTDRPPDGWHLVDDETGVIVEPDGTRRLRTTVQGPNGAYGYFERAYNPETKALELRMAFLKRTGSDKALPTMVSKQPGSPEMIDGKGTPTVQWVTLHQMRALGVPLGGEGSVPGIEKVHLSDIQNVETVAHLHYLKNIAGGDLSDLVVHTASVKYAETTAIQSGYRRFDLPILMGGQETPIRALLDFQEGGSPQRRAENDAILAKYGFDRDTVMRWGFNIDFSVRSAR
jgi:hypothetical protein